MTEIPLNPTAPLDRDNAAIAPPTSEGAPPLARTLHKLLQRAELLLGIVFIGVVVLNFVSAAGRYAGGRPIVGADEVQVFVMVWLIFLGSLVATMRRIHLRMDVLTANMHGVRARVRNVLEALLSVVVCGGMAWISWQFTQDIRGMEQLSDAAEIPMWIPHLGAVVGFGGMALCSLVDLWAAATGAAHPFTSQDSE